jgi:predicted Zn-dependent protease
MYADPSSLHDYFWFNYQLSAGNLAQADTLFAQNLQTAPVHVYKGYLQLLHTTGKHQAIALLIPKLDAHFAHDPDIQLIFYQALAHTGDTKGAYDRLIRLSSQFKTNQEIAYTTAQTYMANHELSNALHVIEDYLKGAPPKSNNFVFHFLKAQILSQQGKKTEALASAKKTVTMQPRFDAGWLLRAVLEEGIGQFQESIKGYITFLELSGGNDMIEKHVLSLFLKQKMAASKQAQLTVATPCLERTVSLFEQKKYDLGLQELDRCLKTQSPKGTTVVSTAHTPTGKK